jgi:hypothetical protein
MNKKINLDLCIRRPALFRGWDDSVENIIILTDIDGDEFVMFEDGKVMWKSSFKYDCEIVEF